MAENIARRLGEATRRGRRAGASPQIVLAAALEVERPVFFSMLMIIVAYLPLLSLTSIEGLLFRPMALTMVFALVGALLFALFVVPVLATFFFRHGYEEWENPLLQLVPAALRARPARPARSRAGWSLAVVVVRAGRRRASCVVPRLGIEFLPYMDEGVIWVRANFPEGHVAAADGAVRPAHPRDRPGVPRHQVHLRAGGPQRQRHRSRSRRAAWR